MLEHLEMYWKGYAAMALCLIPLLYLGRRFVVPVILYIGEMIAYSVIMHTILHYLVAVCVWFKSSSRMYWHRDEPAPPWSTPWAEFWRPENYNPAALYWIEVTAVVIIIGCVIRYRPMKTQKFKPKGPVIKKGVGMQGVKLSQGPGMGSLPGNRY
jgi:hypothetical protein